jgi:hypothetical protein
VEGTRKRLWIVMAALTFGGLGLILATIYAFEVVEPPRIIQPETATETVDTAAPSAAVSDPKPVIPQTATGQTTPVPDPMPNTQQNVHRNAHHGSKTHGRRVARPHGR